MADTPTGLYIGSESVGTFFASRTYSITATGFTMSGAIDPISWTYSGSDVFLGFSATSGATTPDQGLAVGDTGTGATLRSLAEQVSSETYRIYPVVNVFLAATVTYGNTTVGSLTQLGQKMRIPSTLTQDGPVYYLDDITIECNPTSGNQIRCSYWDPYQSDYTDIFATEDAVTQVLDTADQLAFGPIMITYEEVPETTFTIDGTTYDVDADTTYWYDWVNSSYAPSGSGIEMDPTSSTYFVHLGGTASNYGIFYNGSLQAPGDEIVVGRAYTTGAAYEQHDLTGTTWYFNASPDTPFDTYLYPSSSSINFISNGITYSTLSLDDYTMYYSNPNITTTAYGPQSGPPAWTNQNYRTISITGGTDATNAALYAFISSNATQQ
jgi:hypothetical protein